MCLVQSLYWLLNWLSFLFTSLKRLLFLPKFKGMYVPLKLWKLKNVWLHDINNNVKAKKVPLIHFNQLEQLFIGNAIVFLNVRENKIIIFSWFIFLYSQNFYFSNMKSKLIYLLCKACPRSNCAQFISEKCEHFTVKSIPNSNQIQSFLDKMK